LSPSLALVLSIAAVLVLLRFRVHPGLAIFAGSLLLSFLILPPAETPRLVLDAIIDLQTLRLLGIVLCALTMSRMMEMKGMLVRLANALEAIGPKLAIHVTPVAIGLMPLPGGAVVSAAAMKDLVRRLGLSAGQATFINFWFRHLCEFATPVYPGVIMAGVFLAVPLSVILLHLAPIWILMLLSGTLLSWRILRHAPTSDRAEATRTSVVRELARSAWPVALVFALVILGLDAAPAFLVTVLSLVLQQRLTIQEVERALAYGFDLKIIFLLCAVMVFKSIVEASGAAESLFTEMQGVGMSPLIILIVLPMLIGFSTGLSSAMVGISIPLVTPFILAGGELNGPVFLLAYGAGGMGYLLSPLHLCLILSAEYFKARLISAYRYLLPLAAAVLAGLVAIYLLFA
jgi:integral membrane protein (TIGR00529 family)